MNNFALSPGYTWICCILGLYVDRFPVLSKSVTIKLKSNQDSSPSCLNKELKEGFPAPPSL